MEYRLELQNISKKYGSLLANDCVNLKIKRGSIHALLGENGSGKSTLVNIVYGLVNRDGGRILCEGEEVDIRSPVQARSLGIGIVFQHFALFESLSVAENIALGINYAGSIQELTTEIISISQKYELRVYPDSIIAHLSAGEKQRVEIIRCLLQNPKLLILDEPTSVLTPVETDRLFKTLKKLKQENYSILFIGHKLKEVKAHCDEATVLRQGKLIGTFQLANMQIAEIADMMVSSKMIEYIERKDISDSRVLLKCHIKQGSARQSKIKVDNLELKTGEIVGIAGIAGNGQDELMSILAGEQAASKQALIFDGEAIGHWSVQQRNKANILFVPTERLGRSAVTQISLFDNSLLGVSKLTDFVRNGLIKKSRLSKFTKKIIQDFKVKANGIEDLTSSLSGGNLQKFIVGRTILQIPKVLLIANPTWGVDINSAIFIRNRILQLRDQGVAVLVASEDLEELLSLCDKITVIREGELSKSMPVQSLSIEKIGLMMTE